MTWPPYELLDRAAVEEAQRRYRLLTKAHTGSQTHAWDGPGVVAELIAKHGKPNLAPDVREAVLRVFTPVMWSELAAWTVSLQLANMLEPIEARLAATAQAVDESRHFLAMRDYLLSLGEPLPPLDGFTQRILQRLMDTPHAVDKLVGLQLLLEPTALALFRAIAESDIDPVLAELMPYLERDEARHIGIGVNLLPGMLANAGPMEAARIRALQLEVVSLAAGGALIRKKWFATLGIDNTAAFQRGMRLLNEVMEGLRAPDGTAPRGVLIDANMLAPISDLAVRAVFPASESALPVWHRASLAALDSLLRVADRGLRAAS